MSSQFALEMRPNWADARGYLACDTGLCLDLDCSGSEGSDRNWGYQKSSKNSNSHLAKEIDPGMPLWVWALMSPCLFPCCFGCIPMHQAIVLHIDEDKTDDNGGDLGLVVEIRSKSCCAGSTLRKRVKISDVSVKYSDGAMFTSKSATVTFSSENDSPLIHKFKMPTKDTAEGGPALHNSTPEIEIWLTEIRKMIDEVLLQHAAAPPSYELSESQELSSYASTTATAVTSPVNDSQIAYAEAVPMNRGIDKY